MTVGASSGTYNFGPALSEITIEAFDRIQVRPAAMTRHHWVSARNSLDYIFVEWANRGINLWQVDQQTIQLVAGQSTYPVQAETISLLDVYFTAVDGGGTGIDIDRILSPIGRDEYAMIPNKSQVGTPTTYWYQKLVQPQITFWQPPETGAPTYLVKYYRLRRTQDAVPEMGQTPDVQYRFLDALAYAVAARMAEKFAPEKMGDMEGKYERAWSMASGTDREDVNIKVSLDFSRYYR